ncbi:serine acetyltransferase [Ornithinimicrobium faecis]|uniref:serine acetyltransferase n=1 Tax=Ornithinimicrobium faecis TaxID=2934158 RepID=UPI002118E11D|nr:serine O-acetyltransferase [Ornithinimicrobium sp. HY1745]
MRELLEMLREDIAANRGQAKGALVVASYRVAHAARKPLDRKPSVLALPVGVTYRVLVEWILGVEIPWGTPIGRRLRVFHGVGIVINDRAVLGDDVAIRQSVTIGNMQDDGPCPTIGDRVELGAGCIVIGDISVGSDARVGAGAVVTKSVPPGGTALGTAATVRLPQ